MVCELKEHESIAVGIRVGIGVKEVQIGRFI